MPQSNFRSVLKKTVSVYDNCEYCFIPHYVEYLSDMENCRETKHQRRFDSHTNFVRKNMIEKIPTLRGTVAGKTIRRKGTANEVNVTHKTRRGSHRSLLFLKLLVATWYSLLA